MAPEDPPLDEHRTPDFWTLQTELAELVSGARRFQHKLREAALAADERARRLQSKVEELEAENLTRAVEISQLEARNAELQHIVEGAVPDLHKAIHTQDLTQKKLDRAHKVIKDLLNDRKKLEDAIATSEVVRANRETSTDSEQVLPTASGVGSKHSRRKAAFESDGDSTVRPEHSAASSRTASMSRLSYQADSAMTGEPLSAGSPEATMVSAPSRTHSSASAVAAKGRVSWYLELLKSPATAEVAVGPIPFDVLAEQLALDGDTMDEIERLEFTAGYDTRISGEAAIAFVYRPVILEGLSGTYFIGWGDAKMVRNAQNWTKNSGELHMFVHPAKENQGWFYLGVHTLTFAALDPVWHKLNKGDKEQLYVELRGRNPDMNIAQFKKDVKDGRLVQCCIQLRSEGKKTESLEFLREYDLLDGNARIG